MKRTSEITSTRSGIPCVIAFALFAAGVLPAADMYTGFRERSEVNVAEGTTLRHTGLMLQSGESVVNKTGKGTWQVPVESIRQKAPFDIRVREGSLRLTTGGATPEVAKPSALLNRAMFWLSAKGDDGERSAKLSVSNGTDGVTYLTRWCDERETEEGDGSCGGRHSGRAGERVNRGRKRREAAARLPRHAEAGRREICGPFVFRHAHGGELPVHPGTRLARCETKGHRADGQVSGG